MKHLGLLAIAFVAACGCKSKPATTTADNTGGAPAVSKSRTIGPVTLVALQAGDASCNVEYTAADGSDAYADGDFEVCEGGGKDATALIGKSVTLTLEQGNILAASCEGDVDCGKSDTVDLVVEITAQ